MAPSATSPPPPSPAPFSVPTIDFSAYLANPSPDSLEVIKIVNAVREACTTTGFFQLKGHGIPKSLQDALFKGAEALFRLPMEEKIKLDRGKSVGASNRGYELIGGQALQEGSLPDLKEVSLSFPLASSQTLSDSTYNNTNTNRASTSVNTSHPPTRESKEKPS